jgi:drug/metabolite transporter (DMT)-like permease
MSQTPNGKNSRFGASDALMLIAVVMWGSNFSFIKIALRELSPGGFNGVRLLLTALVFCLLMGLAKERFAVSRKDFWKLLAIGVAGNTIYQLLFIRGVSLTTASNSSLILSTSPIFVALMSAGLRIEKIHWAAWGGIFISFFGLYLVIAERNGGLRFSSQSLKGDFLIFLGTILWASYTVLAKPFLEEMSPLKFSAITVGLGTLFYLPFTAGDVIHIPWGTISWQAWASLFFSALFGLILGYLIWYYSVKKVGNAKTAVYNSMTPIFTVFFAVIFLQEKFSAFQAVGAVVILAGVYLTRAGYRFFIRSS